MDVVFKYMLDSAATTVRLPKGTKFLDADFQPDHAGIMRPVFWAQRPEREVATEESRRFMLVPTGEPFSHSMSFKYLKTLKTMTANGSNLVLHLYEDESVLDLPRGGRFA